MFRLFSLRKFFSKQPKPTKPKLPKAGKPETPKPSQLEDVKKSRKKLTIFLIGGAGMTIGLMIWARTYNTEIDLVFDDNQKNRYLLKRTPTLLKVDMEIII